MSDDTLRLFASRGSRDFRPDDDQVNGGAPGIVGRITTTTGSIGVGKFFLVQPQALTGGECEGCTGTFTDLPTTSIPVYNLGPGSYVQGDKVLARFVRSRWVSGRGGTSGCSSGTLVFTVTACSAALSGATVTVTGPGGFSASGTTDGSGQITFSVVGYPAGTYSWTVSKGARYVTQSGTKAVTCGILNGQSVTLSAATGYTCMGCCGIPIKNTLNVTTPFGGTGTLTLGYLSTAPSLWAGDVTESLPCRQDAGCGTLTNASVTNTWLVGGSSGFACGASGFSLGNAWDLVAPSTIEFVCDAAAPSQCPGGSPRTFNFQKQISAPAASYTCDPFSFSMAMEAIFAPFTGVRVNIGTIYISE